MTKKNQKNQWIHKQVFSKFNWKVLDKEQHIILHEGVEKHTKIIKTLLFFLPFQATLAIIAPEIFVLLSAMSFISLLLGGAWYQISFQNISFEQLNHGIAEFITKRMFRGFMLALNMLLIGTIIFITKTILPEIGNLIIIEKISIWIRAIIITGNISWLILIWSDIYLSSVCYDGTDSLLGDGFPTLMKGAQASQETAKIIQVLNEINKKIKKQ